MKVTLKDLILAYRKAKVDLFYSPCASLRAIADYESNLHNNLRSLLKKINSHDTAWAEESDFLGSWTLHAKSITKKQAAPHPIFSSPDEEWDYLNKQMTEGEHHTAEFRVMSDASINFHVFSALWIMRVGSLYDSTLGVNSYGNRLRRKENGEFSLLSLGSFTPYLKPYSKWRDNAISKMLHSLEENKNIIALTADISSFYHELNPNFMLNDQFNKLFSVKFNQLDKKINTIFIELLCNWSKSTPLKKGLPVGLPASSIVANLSLIELDRIMEQEVSPLYYGRYVDDILLVIDNNKKFTSSKEVWSWIFKRSNGYLSWEGKEENSIRFKPEYLKESNIIFNNEKNKIFFLSGSTGKTMALCLRNQINERASEWRALPIIPFSEKNVATDLVTATQSDGDRADSLRKMDAMTMRRSGFALKLRDFEAYERDLPPEAWAGHRHAFLEAFINHVMVLPNFFELERYLARIIQLAVSCEDFGHLDDIIKKLETIKKDVRSHCKPKVKSLLSDKSYSPECIIVKWEERLKILVEEAIISAFPYRLTKVGAESWRSFSEGNFFEEKLKDIQSEKMQWFCSDLAYTPFRFIGLPRNLSRRRSLPTKDKIKGATISKRLLPNDAVAEGVTIVQDWLDLPPNVVSPIFFATRPLNVTELYIAEKKPCSFPGRERIDKALFMLRGYTLGNSVPSYSIGTNILDISTSKFGAPTSVTIALSSWKTDQESWVASVMNKTDPKALDRYKQLNDLINHVISQPHGAKYLIFPELSLPAQWFLRFANKLRWRGISLISGIEYRHRVGGKVRNQAWASLVYDVDGFPTVFLYTQDKQRAALHEERELERLNNKTLSPINKWEHPPILKHGDFRFSILVCSELTNIEYRSSLRGKIDALFALEWNRDIDTFNSIVESASLDIHTYIVQCNDRQFGDSRIRAPYRDVWIRDAVRVKGGISDYIVFGNIDVLALRKFQSNHRSPDGPFKPVPDGFKIAKGRKVLPD